MRKSLFARKMFLEGLENRTMLAGNVTAFVDDGDLIVRGNAANNGVAIHQTGAGEYVVSGFALNGATKVNGGSNPVVLSGVTGDVIVDLQAGDDVLVVGNNASARQALANQLSDGDAGTLPASPEDADDGVHANKTGITGDLIIQAGDGNDGVGLNVDVDGATRVDLGIGSDELIARNSNFDGDVTLDAGAGNDIVTLANIRAMNGIFANLGGGNDRLNATGVRAGGLAAYGGAEPITFSSLTCAPRKIPYCSAALATTPFAPTP